MAKISAQVLKGTRDLLPERMILRHYVIGALRAVFEQFGFEPLETPALEYAETLEGKLGEEGEKLMYRFEDRGGRRVALRYDLTVPLARVAATYHELPRPFKRYQIAPVWRAENTQKGRYREFWQCDVDTVGSSSMLADAEAVAVVYRGLTRLGFNRFRVKINHRQLLVALAEHVGVTPERATGVYRSVDKLDKIGAAGVERELAEYGLDPAVSGRLLDVLRVSGPSEWMLASLSDRLGTSEAGARGVHELGELVGYLGALGVPESAYVLDLSMVRGLDYYTGPIFETVVEEPKIGSVSGGGRYDKLVGIFASQDVPATGVSFGLERLVDVIEELAMRPPELRGTVTDVLVACTDETRLEALRLASELRDGGARAEIYLGRAKLDTQLKYANRKQIPLALILGPDELTAGTLQLKDLVARTQTTIARSEAAAAIQRALAAPSR